MQNKNIAMVGAGWYGCHLALKLRKAGHVVKIFEAQKNIFLGASCKNQNRLHKGYHYPRDSVTRKQSCDGFNVFMQEYPNLVENIKNNIYAISKNNSLIDFDTYKLIMVNSGCNFESVNYDYLNSELISGAINTEEKLIKNDLAQAYFINELEKHQIQVVFDYEVKSKELIGKTINDETFDVVINCTWGTLESSLLEKHKIYYEPCIYFYYSSFDKSKDFALTVMDGELFSLYPYFENIYTLTSVKYTPIVKTHNIETAKQVLNDVTQDFKDERRKLFEEQTCQYMPDFLERFKFEGVELSLKTKTRSQSDSRFCIVEHDNGLIDVFSGKIDTLKFAEESVFKILDEIQ